ncbi:C40 family peptidase [Lysobacter enzymogenes]|uniref:C40 family peptidase n=1 Tax=Lysobacter enzymogenes TaxID=69 RepID=UPI000898AF61|nr:NlpC/P60 family protein [Lysobacter enzymogenes]SDW95310.1 NlpC/P60 family protein [Lysobacter enzymogenes]
MTGLHEAARAYLRSPFLHQGRSGSGLDCVGLLVLALKDCGRAVDDVTSYGRDPHRGLLEARLVDEFGPAIALDDLQPGDVVAIDFAGAVRHVAIVGDYVHGGVSLIHTDESLGEVIEHRIDAKWARRIKGAWRP